jgi:predicted esterase
MRLRNTVLCLAVLAAGSSHAHAVDVPIEGRKLVLTRSNSGKEKLVFLASDPAIDPPAPGGDGDPTLHGVTIELHSGLDGASDPMGVPPSPATPPARWKDLGPDYEFVHKGAPDATSGVKTLVLREKGKLRIVAKEVPLPLSGRNVFVTIRITMGDTRYCARFDPNDVKRDHSGRFVAARSGKDEILDCTDFGLGLGGGPILPTNVEPCPTIQDGIVNFRGNPVRIRVAPDAAGKRGPLVFVWHGLGSNPNTAILHLLGVDAQIQQILDLGGVVAAPFGHGPPTEFGAGDFFTTDEIVACAIQQIGIDPFRIHSVGFSAGGLVTTLMSAMRSNYVASIVGFSGGFYGTDQNPDNLVPALVAHGGPGDVVFIPFEPLMENYYDQIVSEGHFAILCDHGQNHTVPLALLERTLPFFLAHPFGTTPSPYAGGLPAEFPAYCIASD